MFPDLRPQIRKSEIDTRIALLKTRDHESCHKTVNWFDKHRFYLTAEECGVVNAELARIYSAPYEVGELRIQIPTFAANPAMNNSYYLPEP
jgi:secreted Zn-dependent insulinase-like peptidase